MKLIEIYHKEIYKEITAELKALYKASDKLYKVHISLFTDNRSYVNIKNADTGETIYHRTQNLPEPNEKTLMNTLKEVEKLLSKIEG